MLSMLLGSLCRGGGSLYIMNWMLWLQRRAPRPPTLLRPSQLAAEVGSGISNGRSAIAEQGALVCVERLFEVAVHLPENQPSEWVEEKKQGIGTCVH
jgi:hypothetical protein